MVALIKSITKLYIPVIAVILLGYSAKINWGHGQWESVIEADAKGYYAYLPAILIYNDLNFGFYDEVEVKKAYDPNLVYDYRYYYEGHCLNKYFVGESVLLFPFYLSAHLATPWTQYEADGYSRLYVISVTVAALFYLVIGLVALKKTLSLMGISEWSAFLAISMLVFGTNLFYYSIGEMGTSHVYSFSMIALFNYHMAMYFRSLHAKHIIYSAIVLGLIVLIRPINFIVIFAIPFLSQDVSQLAAGFKAYFRRWKLVALSAGIVLAIYSIQLIVYKLQTGSFFVYSYGEEGFNFGAPEIVNFLFSYRKGFFVYTPLCLLALAGFAFMGGHQYRILSLLSFLILVVYVLSSWWMWYYGGSFSSRVMVDYLPFFAVLLGLLFHGIAQHRFKGVFYACAVALVLLNQVQTLQYRYYIIHWSEMDKELYWSTFLDLKPVLNRRDEIAE